MKKFIKRTSLLLLLSLSIGVGYFYYKGISADQALAYAESFFNAPNKQKDTVQEPKQDKGEKALKKKKTDRVKEKLTFLPVPGNPFSKIDKTARNVPKSVEVSIEQLAKYLEEGTNNDLEKSRAIYVWLTDNIAYDDKGFNSGNYSDTDAESVLKNKTSVCEGYSNLFLELGKRMNLKIRKVSGYAKGYSYSVGDKFTKTDHAWNMIKINGKWGVFDATWGRGFGEKINGKLKSSKEFDDYWFNTDPYEAIFSHLPEEPSIATVSPVMNLKTYESIQNVSKNYFRLGFDGKTTYKKYLGKRTLSFPECYNIDTYVEMRKAHKYELLKVGKEYNFEFYVPRGIEMSVISSDNSWSYFDRKDGVFKINYTPNKTGELKISCKHEKGGKSYHTVMIYKVIDQRPST